MHEAHDDLTEARAERDRAMADGRYPDDFPERLARAEVRWRDMQELTRPPMPAGGIGAGILVLLGVALGLLTGSSWAVVIGAAGLVLGLPWLVLWAGGQRRVAAARRQAERELDGVPGADSLGPDSRDGALSRFRDQRHALAREAQARDELADTLREARRLLREATAVATGPADGGEDGPVGGDGGSDSSAPDRIMARLEAAVEATHEAWARGQSEMDRISDASLRLPDDVPPTEEGVAAALRRRRAERVEVQTTLQEVGQELRERGTPAESVEALRNRLAALEPRLELLRQRADVLESAYALVVDAYDAFREHDQDRLARRVSDHVRRLGDGRLEGVEVENGLEDARVRTRGRLVPMEAPPLSFGEYHALQLGVRLGAADFLAGVGILPPLVVDEPFAHLDTERAHAVWRLLGEIAAHRQVILATQDERLLDTLGVEPDIRLTG